MTVGELIKELCKFNRSLEVVVCVDNIVVDIDTVNTESVDDEMCVVIEGE